MDSEGNPVTREDIQARGLENSLLPSDLAHIRECFYVPMAGVYGVTAVIYGVIVWRQRRNWGFRTIFTSGAASFLSIAVGGLASFLYCNDKGVVFIIGNGFIAQRAWDEYIDDVLAGRLIISNREQALQQLKRTPIPSQPYYPQSAPPSPNYPNASLLPTQHGSIVPPSTPRIPPQYHTVQPQTSAQSPQSSVHIAADPVQKSEDTLSAPAEEDSRDHRAQPNTNYSRAHSHRRGAPPLSTQDINTPIPGLPPQQRTLPLPPHLQMTLNPPPPQYYQPGQVPSTASYSPSHPQTIPGARGGASIPPGRTLPIPSHLQSHLPPPAHEHHVEPPVRASPPVKPLEQSLKDDSPSTSSSDSK